MSTSRLLSVFVTVVLVVVAVLMVRAGTATSEIMSNSATALDQQERHPGFIVLSAPVAEQARIDYRRGEWSAGEAAVALDQHERHISAIRLGYTLAALDQFDRHSSPMGISQQAQLEYRRDEWYAGGKTSTGAFDVEQARIQWRATE